jgi:hypothetical protein
VQVAQEAAYRRANASDRLARQAARGVNEVAVDLLDAEPTKIVLGPCRQVGEESTHVQTLPIHGPVAEAAVLAQEHEVLGEAGSQKLHWGIGWGENAIDAEPLDQQRQRLAPEVLREAAALAQLAALDSLREKTLDVLITQSSRLDFLSREVAAELAADREVLVRRRLAITTLLQPSSKLPQSSREQGPCLNTCFHVRLRLAGKSGRSRRHRYGGRGAATSRAGGRLKGGEGRQGT